MADTLRASSEGKLKIQAAIQAKGYPKQSPHWLNEVQKYLPSRQLSNGKTESETISTATWIRFYEGKQGIKRYIFIACCKALGLNWEDVAEPEQIGSKIQQTGVSSSSNNSWVGRKELIDELGTKLRGDCRVLILTGITGIGKSHLAARLTIGLDETCWTKAKPKTDTNTDSDILTTESQETSTTVSLEFDSKTITDFASVAADLLLRWNESITSDDRRDPLLLLNRLLRRLQEKCYILILNSVENLLQGDAEKGWSEFQDKWWENFFNRLLEDSCESKIIITSQDLPRYFDEICFNNPELCHYRSLNGFTKEEQLEFFDILGLDVGDESGNKSALENIGELFEGHPLGLRVIAGEIIDDPIFNGDAAKYWQKYGEKMLKIKAEYNIEDIKLNTELPQLHSYSRSRRLRNMLEYKLDETFKRLPQDAYFLLCHAAVYNLPVSREFWLTHLEYLGKTEEEQNVALDILYDRFLVEEEINEDETLLKQHPLIRSVALACLKRTITKQEQT